MVEVYYKLIKEGLRTLESIKDPQIKEMRVGLIFY